MEHQPSRIEVLKRAFYENADEQLLELFRKYGVSDSYKQLGQVLLWTKDLEGFARLISIGSQLKNGELEILNLGLQLIPPGLPENAWACPPLCDLLEAGYKCVEQALSGQSEPLELFRDLAVNRQRAARLALRERDTGLAGWG